MTHAEREYIKAETGEIIDRVCTANRLLEKLWEDFFSDALPRQIDANEAEHIDDLMRVIIDHIDRSIMDYDELTARIGTDATRVRLSYNVDMDTAAKAEELFGRAHTILMEHYNNMRMRCRFDEIGKMKDAEAIPALEQFIKELDSAKSNTSLKCS